MRLFFAIELGEDVNHAWEQATEELRVQAPEFAWVPAARRHLTLKFLGEVAESGLGTIIEWADEVARASRPFDLQLHEIGAFPNFRRARVVWIGVVQATRLELLHHDLELGGVTAGFEVEGRPFRPHLTIARVRTTPDIVLMRKFAQAARGIELSTTAIVHGITLFESTRSSTGAYYRRLHVAKLGG